jgi:elongin-A
VFLQGTDLSPVTDKLWKKFFEKQFGIDRTNEVIEIMSEKRVSFRWLQLYEVFLFIFFVSSF